MPKRNSQKSVMKHQFSQVPKAEIQRASFDRSHGLKTTFNAGPLIPIFVDEALPGDTFNLKMTALARLATPIFPTMDNMFMETFFFAVPYRLVWDNWEKFMGQQTNPGDSTDFLIPTTTTTAGTGEVSGSISDYFGIPTGIPGLEVSALWYRAYNLIWNDWFRDENLQNSKQNITDDGPDPISSYTLQSRGKRHDYFTSCLPFPQKGDSIDLPLGVSAPIIGIDQSTNIFSTSDVNQGQLQLGAGITAILQSTIANVGEPTDLRFGAQVGLEADLTSATAATINQLRQAFQIQRMLERDARGGTRYTEIIKSHFGVTSPDQRLQRPEYLGGGSTPVGIVPVASTVPTELDPLGPQGTLAGYGTAEIHNHGFTKSFTEHSLIIGLVNVRADLTYQQGLHRMWSRQTRFDFYFPALSHLGEQGVLNKEIYAQGTVDPVADEAVFGYQEVFAEYRYKNSQITGKLRSSDPETLDAWHLSQFFDTAPALNDNFITDKPPIERIIAVPTEPHFIFDSYFSFKCARPMPLYGVPGYIDHF